ncbi:arsenate reductase family protein [Paratissierella segnis]|jgi:arsenate reductase|uniref:Arsenate reductase family protein n=1 Tax=Paratissierella segnis TaxID=2763679 RepID=A0A926EUE2_9FIRM|nr:arsenate reductase family protein [Paratissierella segnis]MBC8586654.1 arsenate reductase family protein [Paratissierella segnis]
MKYIFICYPRCTTCKKAKDWLDKNNIEYDERNIKENNPSKSELKEWISKSGKPIKKFFNTSGTLYRELNVKDKLPNMNEDEQIELLSTDGMLVKRPILVGENTVLVGFKEDAWSSLGGKDGI